MFGRDQDKKIGVELAQFETQEGATDIEQVLQRYDLKTSFYIRG